MENEMEERAAAGTFGEAAGPAAAAPPQQTAEVTDAPISVLHWVVEPTAVLLFRYSALTFNGHRIHYDLPYARDAEGYPGLVVHGPLQASLLINMATFLRRRIPRRFSYRGVSPLIAPGLFQVDAVDAAAGALECRVSDASGRVTMRAEASW